MRCILFRHGIAVERGEWKGTDADRPLVEKGIKRTRQAAEGLVRLEIVPTHLLASPLARAQQTARVLREAFGGRPAVRICDDLLPDADPAQALPLLQALPAGTCAICIGHEPHLGATAGLLLFGKPVAGLSLKKAGACLIELPAGAAKSARGRLHWWLTPGQLRLLGKARGRRAD
jgi:phosphohistidine phosphatase